MSQKRGNNCPTACYFWTCKGAWAFLAPPSLAGYIARRRRAFESHAAMLLHATYYSYHFSTRQNAPLGIHQWTVLPSWNCPCRIVILLDK